MTTRASKSEPGTSLLLLSSPSANPSRAAIRAAFQDVITAAVAKLPPSSHLQVVVTGSFIPIHWSCLQSLLARLYSLSIFIQTTSNNDDTSITFVLVDHVAGRAYPADSKSLDRDTTILDLQTFASRPCIWSTILQSGIESHLDLSKTYLALVERFHSSRPTNVVSIADEPSSHHGKPADTSETTNEKEAATKLHGNVILAGTFDQFHAGHKLLLNGATLLLRIPPASDAESAQTIITIGVTGDELLKNKKFASEIEPWANRATSVINFIATIFSSPSAPDIFDKPGEVEELRAIMCDNKLLVRCVQIIDIYGPTITEQEIEALVVSAETRTGGAAVNEKRVQQGWNELALYEVNVLDAKGDDETDQKLDFSGKISSTDIRRKKAELK